jgi:hypothetical protein
MLRLEHAGFTEEQESTFTILKGGWSGEKMHMSLARVVDNLG